MRVVCLDLERVKGGRAAWSACPAQVTGLLGRDLGVGEADRAGDPPAHVGAHPVPMAQHPLLNGSRVGDAHREIGQRHRDVLDEALAHAVVQHLLPQDAGLAVKGLRRCSPSPICNLSKNLR